jgi:hypothetical protein
MSVCSFEKKTSASETEKKTKPNKKNRVKQEKN